jgi:hypothetical protein
LSTANWKKANSPTFSAAKISRFTVFGFCVPGRAKLDRLAYTILYDVFICFGHIVYDEDKVETK